MKIILVGYARISTNKQILDRQIDELIEAGVNPEYIYQESISGRNRERPELNNMIKALRKEDTVDRVNSNFTFNKRSSKLS